MYVNDALASWQAHASTVACARSLPSYAGLLMQRELGALHALLEPERPFVCVVAGAKVRLLL